VLAYADGWCPLPFPDVPQRMTELRERAKEAGREISVTIHGLSPTIPRDELERWLAAEPDRCTFHLPPAGRDEIERLVEGIRETIQEGVAA
jgi:alkanesulfonate monooxygenase SsuD/methylene tetrahydromethanopterin reductase-like flavin-dependent oxidoreductase (luciferase family)